MATLTAENKRIIKRLLKTGRWQNESEVLRYGLQLVDHEVLGQQAYDLRPYTAVELRAAARRQKTQDRLEERRLAKASLRHRPKEAD